MSRTISDELVEMTDLHHPSQRERNKCPPQDADIDAQITISENKVEQTLAVAHLHATLFSESNKSLVQADQDVRKTRIQMPEYNDNSHLSEGAELHLQNRNVTENRGLVSPKPETVPDEGRAWVIATAGLLAIFLGLGLFRSFGLIVVELQEVYSAPVAQISLMYTCTGIGMCASAFLLMIGLAELFHERAIIIVSSLTAFIGLLVTYLSSRMEAVYFLGFSAGCSLQINVGCSMSLIGQYFKRRLSTANGIAMAGSSIGTLCWPPIVTYLFHEYTYKHGSLVIGAIVLNGLVCAALMKPAKTVTTRIKTSKLNNFRNTEDNGYSERAINSGQGQRSHEDLRPIIPKPSCPGDVLTGSAPLSEAAQQSRSKHVSRSAFLKVLRNWAVRNQRDKIKTWDILTGSLLFFKSFVFVLFQTFIVFGSMGSECLLQFYPAFALEQGMTGIQRAMLLSIVGASDIVSRFVYGFIGDSPLFHRITLVIVPQFILGLACFLSGFAIELWSQIVFAVVIGLNYGINFSFRGVLLVDLFGVKDLSRRVGVSNFLTGISVMISTPLIGFLRDTTGQYAVALRIIGCFFFLNGLSVLAIRVWKRFHKG